MKMHVRFNFGGTMKNLFKLLLLVISIILVGCNPKTPVDDELKVNLYSFGELIEEIDIEKGDLIIAPELEEVGYVFQGWFYELDYINEYDINDIFESTTNLYAKWEANQYTINFFTYGGTSINDIVVEHNKFLTVIDTPTKVGYEFVGWYLSNSYLEEFDLTMPITNSFSLHAKWEEEELELVDTDEYLAYYISTSFAEDGNTGVNINYHTKNIHTNVEYTLASDENYSQKTVINPDMKAFESLVGMEKDFTRRNVCRVTIDNLTPGTKYKYRVNQGDGTYTDDYYFTTGNGDNTSFLFMTDVHFYDGFDGAEVSDEVMSTAVNIQPNINFVLQTGDLVDTGGNSEDWDKFYSKTSNLKNLPFFNVPGNHEHYETGSTRNKIFANYFNFPRNGILDFVGASYFFVYNNVLFVMIDTDLPYNQGEQINWLDKVITENKQDFIIVGTHAPVNVVGNTDYNRAFMTVMEKHGVDLVLAGHYHSDNLRTMYLDEDPFNNQIGVTYLRGLGGGIKAIGDADPLDFAKGYIIDIVEDEIIIRMINAKGDIINTRKVKNHKLSPKEEATNEELYDSIKATPNFNLETIKFEWSSKFFGNVKEMTLQEDYRNKSSIYYIFPTPGYNQHTFANFASTLDNKYTFNITFNDGSKMEKTFEYNNKQGIDLIVEDITATNALLKYETPSKEDLAIIRTYTIYLNDVQLITYNALDTNNNFTPITDFQLTDLIANTEYTVRVDVNGRYGFMYSDVIDFKTK